MPEERERPPEWRTKSVQTARIVVAFSAFLLLLGAWTAMINGALHTSFGGFGIGGAVGLAVATIGAFFAAWRFLRKQEHTQLSDGEPVRYVALDEGGLRWRFEERRGYLPFRAIEDVSHAGSFDDPAVLVKTRVAALHLPTGGIPEDLIINEVLGKRSAADNEIDETLLRNRRPLEGWLREVRASRGITGERGYRGSARVDEHLGLVAANCDADAEMRAAAVHFVLSAHDDDATTRILQTFGSMTPPLVVVAAAIAAPNRVDAPMVETALLLLSHTDEEEARALMRAASPPRVRVAEDKGETLDEQEPEA